MSKSLQIDPSRCKSCGLCLRACPKNCLSISTQRNRAGYLVIQLSIPEACIGCGICVRTCPEPLCLTLIPSHTETNP